MAYKNKKRKAYFSHDEERESKGKRKVLDG